MDARTQRILRIGHATRFKPGNRCSPGRPRTAKFAHWIKRLGLQFCKEPSSLWITEWEQFTRACFREALNGSVPHAQLLARYAGADLWQQTQQVVKEILENPAREWLLRRRSPSRIALLKPKVTREKRDEARQTNTEGIDQVPGLCETGGKQEEDSKNRHFSHVQGVPPGSQNAIECDGQRAGEPKYKPIRRIVSLA